jgi:hypothetical protein
MADSINANQPEQQQQKKGFFGTAASGLGMFPPSPFPLLIPFPANHLTSVLKKRQHTRHRDLSRGLGRLERGRRDGEYCRGCG